MEGKIAMDFKTDLNARERQRYGETLLKTAEHARNAAEAMAANEDARLLLEFTVLSLHLASLVELQQVFAAHLNDQKGAREKEEFPNTVKF